MTRCQDSRWRRATAAMVMSRASATTARARRVVIPWAKNGWVSVVVVRQRLHRNRRRCQTRVSGRPGTGRSRTFTLRVAWTRAVLWPQAEQRITLEMATTATTTRDSGRSSTTASTRTARRWSRIVIASSAATRASSSVSLSTDQFRRPGGPDGGCRLRHRRPVTGGHHQLSRRGEYPANTRRNHAHRGYP